MSINSNRKPCWCMLDSKYKLESFCLGLHTVKVRAISWLLFKYTFLSRLIRLSQQPEQLLWTSKGGIDIRGQGQPAASHHASSRLILLIELIPYLIYQLRTEAFVWYFHTIITKRYDDDDDCVLVWLFVSSSIQFIYSLHSFVLTTPQDLFVI